MKLFAWALSYIVTPGLTRGPAQPRLTAGPRVKPGVTEVFEVRAESLNSFAGLCRLGVAR